MLGKIENWLAVQKDGVILWIPVFLGIGAALYFALAFEPSPYLTGTALLASLAGFFALYKFASHAWIFPRILLFILSLAIGGFALAQFKTHISGTPIILKETRPLMAEGDVIHTEKLEGRKGTLIVLDRLVLENFSPEDTPKKIRLTSKLHMQVNTGDRISVLVKLMPPSRPVMPNAYDFRRHYFFDGVGATGFILKKPIIRAQNSGRGLHLEKLRRTMGDHIRNLLPTRISGIVTALITGERAAIEESDWDALRVSGLAHIISISGLHVVLMAAPIFFFRAALSGHVSIRRVALARKENRRNGCPYRLYPLCRACRSHRSDISRFDDDGNRVNRHYDRSIAVLAQAHFFCCYSCFGNCT